MGVAGRVFNTAAGVTIIAQGENAPALLKQLKAKPPPLAQITSFHITRCKTKRYATFAIAGSGRGGSSRVDVLPDLAVCDDCAREINDRHARRRGYAFTNCTQCGPRYTIVESLPYDRPRTTMRSFRMCADCGREYNDPADRRFHAQPIACPVCGPKLTLLDRRGCPVDGDPLDGAAAALARGEIVAIRSLGGFLLAADAGLNSALRRLRRTKDRAGKPFALMCDSTATARLIAALPTAGLAALRSIPHPIVLLPKRRPPAIPVSNQVAPGNACLGIMLPYTPLHLLLLRAFHRISGRPPVLVMTSANRQDEPITASADELYADLAGAFDCCLTHDRPIANRCDDSVVLPGDSPNAPAILVRRSRGYAPAPLRLPPAFHVKRPVLAVGGELRSCFALAENDRVFLSPHIGDLVSPRAAAFFEETLGRLISWTGIKPEVVACDLHPDYFSTRLAEKLARRFRAKLVRVQHHYAHILSVMAEHGLPAPVIGLACDGTGYGPDKAVWGCELLLIRPGLSWLRLNHLAYMYHHEGSGELADPWRLARAYLDARLQQQTETRPRAIATSSLGRLFDAVAAVTGVCRHATFAGQAALALEAAAVEATTPRAGLFGPRGNGYEEFVATLDPRPLLRQVVADCRSGLPQPTVAVRFHRAVVRALASAAVAAAREYGTRTVCLSGGSFQNRILRQGLVAHLGRAGLAVRHNQAAPLNDGSLALGQVIAAASLFRPRS